MQIPRPAQIIAQAVPDFQGHLFLVGGGVRDALLGKGQSADLDLVTTKDAPTLARHLFDIGVSDIPPVTYERFGTAMVQVAGAQIELVTARRESYRGDSRKPEVEPATILEDAQRRDFTINTLLQDIFTGEVLDPLGVAREDLAAGILRTPLDPVHTFREDPLRMLRAVRFRWQLDLQYAEGLAEAIQAEASRLSIISQERIRDELVKMMRNPQASRAWQDLSDLGLLAEFLPELLPLQGCEQGDYHHLDVWHHSLAALDNTAGDEAVVRWAALLHDIAKPATKGSKPDGRITFYGHESEGARMAMTILSRLRFPHREALQVSALIRHHMRFLGMPKVSPAAARRLVRDLGENLEPLLRLCDADAGALKAGVRTFYSDNVRAVLATLPPPVEAKNPYESPLTGEQIIALCGLEPGPAVGNLKQWLSDLVVEGQIEPGDEAAATAMLEELRANATEFARVSLGERTV
ncbi:MAG: CCA tRNA nucleotidyltransferase [Fimbriimonadaceae bacterium]